MRDSKAKWCPDFCPVTLRPFFMWIEHPELGEVPTYGGPFDSYTLAQPSNLPDAGSIPRNEVEYECLRYDHDEGAWVEYELTAMTVISEDEFLRLSDRDALNTGELATLRAKAKAYDEGFWGWAVYNQQNSMVGRMLPSPELAKRDFMRLSSVWSDEEFHSMWESSYQREGYTCRKVRICKEVER